VLIFIEIQTKCGGAEKNLLTPLIEVLVSLLHATHKYLRFVDIICTYFCSGWTGNVKNFGEKFMYGFR
jgi:hypothetical protein